MAGKPANYRAEYKLVGVDDALDVNFYPVALKIQSLKVTHKTDAGGDANQTDYICATYAIGDFITNSVNVMENAKRVKNKQYKISSFYTQPGLAGGLYTKTVFKKPLPAGN